LLVACEHVEAQVDWWPSMTKEAAITKIPIVRWIGMISSSARGG
jgi:hypothetical protein